jgi:antitoxin VapB
MENRFALANSGLTKRDAIYHASYAICSVLYTEMEEVMPQKTTRAKVFMSGRSQAVRIPAEYRFRSSEVSIRRDPASGDLILSEGPGTWAEVFAALDAANIPEDFMSEAERDMRPPERRVGLDDLIGEETGSRGERK